MSDLVIDDESQGLRVARGASDLEKIRIDGDETSMSVPGGVGVDPAIAEEDIGVGHLSQPRPLGRFDDHPISLGKLRRTHAHAPRTQIGIDKSSDSPDSHGDTDHHKQDDAEDVCRRSKAPAALGKKSEVALRQENLESAFAHGVRGGEQPPVEGNGPEGCKCGRGQKTQLPRVAQRRASKESVNRRAVPDRRLRDAHALYITNGELRLKRR